MYSKKIYRYYAHPKHHGVLEGPDIVVQGQNPYCGDTIQLMLKVDEKDTIVDIAWQGSGCAISQAACSMLCEHIKGLSLNQARAVTSQAMQAMLEIKLSPSRMKCALLPLYTLKEQQLDE